METLQHDYLFRLYDEGMLIAQSFGVDALNEWANAQAGAFCNTELYIVIPKQYYPGIQFNRSVSKLIN